MALELHDPVIHIVHMFHLGTHQAIPDRREGFAFALYNEKFVHRRQESLYGRSDKK
jgi:hypothetical protein